MDADADRPAALPQVLPASRGPVTVRSGGAAAADAETVVLAAYEAYARDLNAFARSLVREREAAEDIVAEAYLRLVREAQAGRTPDDVRGWLYRVTANLVLSRGRRIAVARRFVAHLVDRRTGESPEARHLRLDIEPGLRDALLALPRRLADRGGDGRARRQRAGDRRGPRSQRGRDANAADPRAAAAARAAETRPRAAGDGRRRGDDRADRARACPRPRRAGARVRGRAG